MAHETWVRQPVAVHQIRNRPVDQIVEDIFDVINREQPGLLLELERYATERPADLAESYRAFERWSDDVLAVMGQEDVCGEVWGAVCDYLGLKLVPVVHHLTECDDCKSAFHGLSDDADGGRSPQIGLRTATRPT